MKLREALQTLAERLPPELFSRHVSLRVSVDDFFQRVLSAQRSGEPPCRGIGRSFALVLFVCCEPDGGNDRREADEQ